MDSPRPPKPTAAQGEALERRLTEKLISSGALTREQVDQCRTHRSKLLDQGRDASLAEILIANRMISGTELDVLVAEVLSEEPAVDALPPEAASRPESERFGKFIRVLQLGSGGMGEVWKAWDSQLRRWVALKFLKGRDRADIARLVREAQTAGRLSHPHILPVYEVGSERDEHYIAMQFVEGRTLETWPRQDRKSLVRMMRDAARAVALAHREGVVHRDLKPSNILVAGRPGAPHAFVADFGLAKSMSDPGRLSQSGVLMGTPEFMSPEQARGEAADERSDVWALGATLYELTTDRVPFPGPNSLQVLKKVLEDDPRPPRRIQPRISPDLETIILKCLEKDPERRYAAADDLADDLDRYLGREPIQARPPSRFYRIRKRLGKRKALVSVIAGSAAVVLALAGLLWFRERPEREHLRNFQSGMVAWEELLRSSFGRVDRRELQKQAAATRDHFERANQWVEKPEAHIMRSRCFELERNPAMLMESLERACSMAPDHPEARVALARALLCQYVEMRGTPAIVESPDGIHIEDLGPESGAEAALRERAKSLLQGPGIVSRREDLLEGLLAMGLSDYKAAALRLHRHTSADGLDMQALRLEASCLFYEGNYDEALRAADRSLRLAPSAAVHAWAGLSRLARKDAEAAIDEFDRALALEPQNYFARINRGNGRLQQKRFAEAVAEFTAASELRPADASPFNNRGIARQELREFDSALADLTRAIELKADYTLAYYNRGNTLRLMEDFAAAERDYTRALEFDSKYMMAYHNRGLARWKLGNFKESIQDFDLALALNPGFATSHLNRGNSRQALGDFQGAIQDFNRALELDSTLAMAYFNRGNSRRHLGDMRAAIQDYTKAIQADPTYAVAYCSRSNAHYVLGEFQDSARDAERAVELDPSAPDAYVCRGNVLQERGDLDGAVRDFSKAIELRPKFAIAFHNRGNARRLQRNYQSAGEDYTRAIEIDPGYVPAYLNRGLARCMLKDYSGAIADQRKVLEFAPHRWEPYYNLACAYALKGDTAEALDWLEKSVDRGFRDAGHLSKDTDLDSLRREKRFQDLLERLKTR